jgi:hypothetical protein
MVSEATIVQACVAGDVSLLRQWAKRGIQVTSAEPLIVAAWHGKLDAVRILSRELCAGVNLLFIGYTTLCVAAQVGHEHVVRCLLGECGANVNQANAGGVTALYIAASEGHEHVVRCLVGI